MTPGTLANSTPAEVVRDDKELAVIPAAPVSTELVLMFERLAKDPSVDVEKLERLIAMQERIVNLNAKAEFDAAFAQMQGEIPTITEKGEIIVDGKLRSTYATNEDIQEAVKPMLQRHGFALRFRNEAQEGKLKLIGILSHRSGHSEEDEFVTSADHSGKKNDIHAIGSARSYGQRYTTIALLNIASRGQDDDGEKSGRPEVPKGYQHWLDNLAAVADEGTTRLSDTWAKSSKAYRGYLTKNAMREWEAIKRKAAQVKSGVPR